MLDGVKIIPLRKIPDARGTVMHMLRCDASHFEQFGEIYFSTIYPGIIKGWTIHQRATLNFAVIVGMIKVVLYDARDDATTHGQLQTVYLGQDNYALLIIPPGIATGWQALGTQTAILANCSTLPHDPLEAEKIALSSPTIPYDWSI